MFEAITRRRSEGRVARWASFVLACAMSAGVAAWLTSTPPAPTAAPDVPVRLVPPHPPGGGAASAVTGGSRATPIAAPRPGAPHRGSGTTPHTVAPAAAPREAAPPRADRPPRPEVVAPAAEAPTPRPAASATAPPADVAEPVRAPVDGTPPGGGGGGAAIAGAPGEGRGGGAAGGDAQGHGEGGAGSAGGEGDGDEPRYAGAGFTPPQLVRPGCLEESVRLPRELTDGLSSPVVVRFAVARDGRPGLFQVAKGAADARVAGAIRRAIETCPWRPGTDPLGRAVRMWVILPIRFQRG